MYLDENGLNKLWTKIKNWVTDKISTKADTDDVYSKTDVDSKIEAATEGFLTGSTSVETLDTGETIRTIQLGDFKYFLGTVTKTYINNLTVYFPISTTQPTSTSRPAYISASIMEGSSTSWRGGPYRIEKIMPLSSRSIVLTTESDSLAGNGSDKITFSLMWYF